jgi:hypothetical protein
VKLKEPDPKPVLGVVGAGCDGGWKENGLFAGLAGVVDPELKLIPEGPDC